MDVDLHMNSSQQNHFEIMDMMMMQLKPTQFSRHYQDISGHIGTDRREIDTIRKCVGRASETDSFGHNNFPDISDSSEVEFSAIETPSPNTYHNLSTSFMTNPFDSTSSFTIGNQNSCPNSIHKRGSSMEAMREMIFRMAMMQPVHIDPESVKPPKRKNVKISKDPQSVAARHRRERISERIRILQRLVPGGTKMDTASMLDEAVHYVKFLKKQVQSLEQASSSRPMLVGNYSGLVKASPNCHMVG